VLLVPAAFAPRAPGQAPAPAQHQAVVRGLGWLAAQQHRDGHWEAARGEYPVAMTALAGMAFLMEGSTRQAGRYRQNLSRTVAWLLDHIDRDGRIASPEPVERVRYLFGHGYGLLLLACVYEREKALPPLPERLEERLRQRRLKELRAALTKMVAFTADARRAGGGWYYVSAADGAALDEAAPSAVQVQALLAARHAGVPVPDTALAGGLRYLQHSVLRRRPIPAAAPQEQGPVLFAGIAIALQAGQKDAPHLKEWLRHIPHVTAAKEWPAYRDYYEAQARYLLGNAGYAALLPDAPVKERLTWAGYRDTVLQRLVAGQQADGSWSGSMLGPVYETAARLTALQLDREVVSFYRRRR
jgi:hypothetical protein